MAIGENDGIYYNEELEQLLNKHKIKGFFYKKLGWFKKKFIILESTKCFEYDRIYEKYSIFFKDKKYNIFHLKKIKFLIERKIENDVDSKPMIAECANTYMAIISLLFAYIAIMDDVIPKETYLSIANLLNIGEENSEYIKYIFVLLFIGITFYIFNRLSIQTINHMTIRKKKMINSKKKYLLIINCINKEIEMCEKSDELKKLIVNR